MANRHIDITRGYLVQTVYVFVMDGEYNVIFSRDVLVSLIDKPYVSLDDHSKYNTNLNYAIVTPNTHFELLFFHILI